ncbi:MAG: HNH endonuclease [Phycisphaerales bacterium JB060]
MGPFGTLRQRNPAIIELAERLGRTPSAVGMKACNFGPARPGVGRGARSKCLGYPEPTPASPTSTLRAEGSARPSDTPNGLCLNAFADKAFDRGLFTLDDDLAVAVAVVGSLGPSLRDPQVGGTLDEHLAAWEGRRLRLPERFEPDGEAVRWHRGKVFGVVCRAGIRAERDDGYSHEWSGGRIEQRDTWNRVQCWGSPGRV